MKNYKLIEEKYIEEVASDATVYEHIKTGAKVLTLANSDNNKAFGIGFRTPPKYGNGVAHIVEHSVLSGSRKYKTREPFMDLIKSSLQTFLNAMTYPDKTLYPISSRNKKDFYNLMDVYLDSVFYPIMYDKEDIFLQEGWHYDIKDKDDELKINGVVYNEMKGVYSSSENIVSDAITFNLHKDSSYGVDSGGNPSIIPTLTYEDFLNFHKRYYHPSNSYIYLYGDLDMEEALIYIDKNYLSDFEKKDPDSEIILNEEPREMIEEEVTFSASKEEMESDIDYLAYGWTTGYSDNKLDLFMRNFLSELLIDAEAAPIKRALLDNNMGEDVYSQISSSKPLDLIVVLKNTKVERKEEFKKLIDDTLRDIVKNGIDEKLVLATLSRFEFSFREGGGTQKSIIYYTRAMNAWLYDKSPLDSLSFNETIKYIRENLDKGFIEKYIEEKLLNNNYKILLSAVPELNKNEKENEKLKEKLRIYKESLSEEEIKKLINKKEELTKFQMTDDSKEDKATIPSLELSDISKEVTDYKCIHKNIDKIDYLITPNDTNKIIYTAISHNIDFIKKEELPAFAVLTSLLGAVDTKNYTYKELDNEIYINTGGLGFSTSVSIDAKDSKIFYPRLTLKMKTLEDKLDRGIDLAIEIIKNSKLNSKERIKEILLILKSSIESGILQSGHGVVASIVKSYYSKSSDYTSKIQGIDFYFYLRDLLKDFDNRWEELLEEIENLYKKIFNRNDLIISLTGDEEVCSAKLSIFKKYVDELEDKKEEKREYEFEVEAKNQGIYTTSNVQYVSKGYDLELLGEKFKGDLTVLANILNISYLHYEIRAKGGAYGAGISFARSGDVATYSYRDPNLTKTLEVYDNISKFIESLDLTEEELKNFIIGSMNSFDPLLSPAQIGDLNLSRFITGLSTEEVQKSKNEALETNLSKLKNYAKLLDEVMNKNFFAVLGSEEEIKKNKDLFKEIISLK